LSIHAEGHINANTFLTPAIQSWEIYLADQGKSTYTIKSFKSDLLLLARYLPADIRIGEITTDRLDKFLEWLQNDRPVPCSPKSYSRRVTSIKSFFRWLYAHGRITIDPAEKSFSSLSSVPCPKH